MRLLHYSPKALAIIIGFLAFAVLLQPSALQADMSVSGKALQAPGIKGDDNRVRVNVADYPWRTIGRLNRNGSHCTAVLIGPSTILTAAHCFWDKRQRKWAVPSAYHFVLGYEKGAYRAHSKIDSYTLASGKSFPDMDPESPRVEEDWAIARLREPLGEKHGFLSFSGITREDVRAGLATGFTVIQAGYSRDIAHMLTADENCRIDAIRRGPVGTMLLHQCDATEGDSGSPLLLREGEAYRIMGLHVATILRQENTSEGVALFADGFRDRIPALSK
ncbi:MAG: hypothetical protein CMN55_15660 [Sneathiella sp.]|jgi:protease YdgD|uniref:trypsin-like serine peptidase n=1 Tax=Sneathiella sp. TaxID=1964365 RepID=UPI000C558407|nr:trypsin-like serine protease [Sneathiella sp.]MAL80515.1 hypothetical protein [Sneathiella sp.]